VRSKCESYRHCVSVVASIWIPFAWIETFFSVWFQLLVVVIWDLFWLLVVSQSESPRNFLLVKSASWLVLSALKNQNSLYRFLVKRIFVTSPPSDVKVPHDALCDSHPICSNCPDDIRVHLGPVVHPYHCLWYVYLWPHDSIYHFFPPGVVLQVQLLFRLEECLRHLAFLVCSHGSLECPRVLYHFVELCWCYFHCQITPKGNRLIFMRSEVYLRHMVWVNVYPHLRISGVDGSVFNSDPSLSTV
jgi:hypothetical protein